MAAESADYRLTLREILLEIEDHHKQNPAHGLDCACLDKYIGLAACVKSFRNFRRVVKISRSNPMLIQLGDSERRDLPIDLRVAADEFLRAARNYRQFLKKQYPDRLCGVVYVESRDGELALYSESSRYTEAMKSTVIKE